MDVGIRFIKLGVAVSQLKSREDVLLEDLRKFYNSDLDRVKLLFATIIKRNKKNEKITYASETSKQQLHDFIADKEDLPSLRTHDWFVTNYSKKNDTNYYVNIGADRYKHIFVHRDYKAQLDSYSKKLFDPFCRRARIVLIDPYGNRLKTTASQLNYFRWAIQNLIIEYVQEHLKEIEDDMKLHATTIKQTIEDDEASILCGTNKSERELTISATKLVTHHKVEVTVSFK